MVDSTGQWVAKYAISNSDQPYSGSHPRGDLLSPNVYTAGSTSFTSVPIKLPVGMPSFAGNGASFYQWAEAKDVRATENGWGLGLHGNSYSLGVTHLSPYGYAPVWVGPVVDGNWHTAVLEVNYETTRTGWVRMWWDGQPVTFVDGSTTLTGIATITDGASAWPLDINSYRSFNTIPGTLTTWHGAPKIGPTLDSVMPTVH